MSQHPVDPNIACADSDGSGGQGVHTPLENISYKGFLWNKQLELPPPWKKGWTPHPNAKNIGRPLEPWKIINAL